MSISTISIDQIALSFLKDGLFELEGLVAIATISLSLGAGRALKGWLGLTAAQDLEVLVLIR